jgi:SAM-dependent methyltransferase
LRRRRLARRRIREAHRAAEAQLRAAGVDPLIAYWEARYVAGSDSGAGSSGTAARRKAAYINKLVEQVGSVVDWGCGDGQQLDLLDMPPAYLGIDISATAVAHCLRRHPGRAFLHWPAGDLPLTVRADLAMSLDVIFHLVDDIDFARYWRRLFDSATRMVLVHATDVDLGGTARHVRHRRHSHLAPPGWELIDRPADATIPGFYLWRRV